VDCVLEDISAWSGNCIFAVADARDVDWARQKCDASDASHVQCVVQRSGNLGQRIHELQGLAMSLGFRKQIYIGSDAPALSMDHLNRVVDALEKADVVLIPATDGGVVLMASALPWPELGDLPWSTGQLRAALIETCREASLSVGQLDALSDIDTVRDLRDYLPELRRDNRKERSALLAVISEILER
jgi:glycosyltransferase A (GT-A) superfamily protein (DUF2064 family)